MVVQTGHESTAPSVDHCFAALRTHVRPDLDDRRLVDRHVRSSAVDLYVAQVKPHDVAT